MSKASFIIVTVFLIIVAYLWLKDERSIHEKGHQKPKSNFVENANDSLQRSAIKVYQKKLKAESVKEFMESYDDVDVGREEPFVDIKDYENPSIIKPSEKKSIPKPGIVLPSEEIRLKVEEEAANN